MNQKKIIEKKKEKNKFIWMFASGLSFGLIIGMIFGQLSLISYAGNIFNSVEIKDVKIGLNETTITKLIMEELNPEICLRGCIEDTGNITQKCYNSCMNIGVLKSNE